MHSSISNVAVRNLLIPAFSVVRILLKLSQDQHLVHEVQDDIMHVTLAD
jgi:hypothetical protein